jgi:hypothetical protein
MAPSSFAPAGLEGDCQHNGDRNLPPKAVSCYLAAEELTDRSNAVPMRELADHVPANGRTFGEFKQVTGFQLAWTLIAY